MICCFNSRLKLNVTVWVLFLWLFLNNYGVFEKLLWCASLCLLHKSETSNINRTRASFVLEWIPFFTLVLARQTTIFFRANHNPTLNLLWRSFSCIDLVITYTLKTPAEMLHFDAKAFHFEIPFIRQAIVKHLCSIGLFIVLVAGLLSH